MSADLCINRVTAHLLEMPLNFSYSFQTLTMGRAILWEIATPTHTGFGECTWIAEPPTAASLRAQGSEAAAALRARVTPWVTPLLGRDARALEALLPAMPPVRDTHLLVVREGLSIGLYDLVGKAHGLPVHALLGGRRRQQIPGMPVIHVGTTEVMVRRAGKWAAAGYRFLKVKFRGALAEDVAAIQAIRQHVGPDVALVVDANDGYRSVAQAAAAIEALRPCRIDYFEDMLNASPEEIAELRRRTQARIMVDAQGAWPHIHDVVRAQAADVINHHPNNQGGLATALQINAVASAAGLETAIGSCGFFGVQNAAFMQLAAVIGLTRPCEDIGLLPYALGPTRGEYTFDENPTALRASYPITQGVIQIPDTPGLGVEIDPERLGHFAVARLDFA